MYIVASVVAVALITSLGLVVFVYDNSNERTQLEDDSLLVISDINWKIPDSCTQKMIWYLEKYTNIFTDEPHVMWNQAGLPEGVDNNEFDVCFAQAKENRLNQKLAEKTPASGYDVLPLSDDPMYDAVFTGDVANKICKFLEIPCPDEPRFRGNYDFSDKSGFVNFINEKGHYMFKIFGDDHQVLVKVKGIDRNYVTLPEYAIQDIPEKNIEMLLNKQTYRLGDSIKISGIAYDYRDDHVIVHIFDPNLQLMDAAKIKVDTLGRFSHSFDSYSSWELGMYKIQIYDDEIKFEQSFEIIQ